MNHHEIAEKQATETLKLISFQDPMNHWEDFINLPKIQTYYSKKTQMRIFQT